LFRTAEEGMCHSCHPDIPGEAAYVHGPVAVNDCLTCHHYHQSILPKLLLKKVNEVCFECHDSDDLIEGAHHAKVDEQPCNECHDPHGGADPYFLKRDSS
jgi:predicted CXXCH cytochrome family protein